ncbi:hypothetical protein DQ04_06631060, partial [Trypanosoma grayi]|uniref:hypothetical protein n=1 Tax=Trypanosoma grayi TaxID=71804 RepID=UPI0004F4AE6B
FIVSLQLTKSSAVQYTRTLLTLLASGGIAGQDVFGRSSKEGGRRSHKTGSPHGEVGIGSHQRYFYLGKRPGCPTARLVHSKSVGRNRSTLKAKFYSPLSKQGNPHCRLRGHPKGVQNRPPQSGTIRGYRWGRCNKGERRHHGNGGGGTAYNVNGKRY